MPPERAHPRPCGEHSSSLSLPITPSGSSPPVRGARHPDRQLLQPRGLIPARAGSTVGRCGQGCGAWAHPRPCGEHERIWAVTGVDTGSSPPVRGAPYSALIFSSAAGLIPARAGSTAHHHPRKAPNGAHPRPCGEHLMSLCTSSCVVGSSPPVRGALYPGEATHNPGGLIPARAGSTKYGACRQRTSRAHPRPCGEHGSLLMPKVPARGSSPPVRGALPQRCSCCPPLGLIPARAGSTPPLGAFSIT